MKNLLDSFKKVEHKTSNLPDGRFVVSVGPIDYVIGIPATDDATILTFQLQKVAAPLTAAAAADGKLEPEMMVYALSEGLSQMGALEYLAFIKLLLKDVLVGGVSGQPAGTVWDAWFKGRQGDIGLLIPYAIQHSGITDFFGGLISVLSTLSQAHKPESTSQTESTGLNGKSTASPQS